MDEKYFAPMKRVMKKMYETGLLVTSCQFPVTRKNSATGQPGNRQLATGNWQLATGNWQLATGNWQLLPHHLYFFIRSYSYINTISRS
jgi:hypothetical protein